MLKLDTFVDNFKIFVTHFDDASSIRCNDWRYYLTLKIKYNEKLHALFSYSIIGKYFIRSEYC